MKKLFYKNKILTFFLFKTHSSSRIDKIKTLDISIAYVQHLQSLLNNEQTTKQTENNVCSQMKQINNNKSENLFYMKGLHNGTIELISYLIECTQTGMVENNDTTSNSSSSSSSGTEQICESVEYLLELFRQFHRIYFSTHKLDNKDLEFVTSSLKSCRFPMNNKKIIQKVVSALDKDNIQLPDNFYMNIFKTLQKIDEPLLKRNSTIQIADIQTNKLKTAKKLKTNLIERFNDTSSTSSSSSSQEIEETKNISPVSTNNNLLPVFILNKLNDFYVSACIDESLIDKEMLQNIFNNKMYKPNLLQKIKLDVLFSSDIVVQSKHLQNS